MKRVPWGTVGCLVVAVVLAFKMAHEVIPALLGGGFLWVMLGLPADAYLRTGRMSTAFTWGLFPWFVAWFSDSALEHVTDPESLWHVPAFGWVPEPLRDFAGFPGFVVGLGLCAVIEKIENRTGRTPTVLPLQVFGLLFGGWLVLSMAKVISTDGQFLFGVAGVCLGWLAVRVLRTVLNTNQTRQEIERRKATRFPPASPGS